MILGHMSPIFFYLFDSMGRTCNHLLLILLSPGWETEKSKVFYLESKGYILKVMEVGGRLEKCER